MAPELGGSQISALLESVPGIARVLRSPVADAIVNMIRAGARLEPFNRTDAEELIQFAIRRGLINSVEGDQVLKEIKGIGGRKRPSKTPVKKSYPQTKKPSPFRRSVPKPVPTTNPVPTTKPVPTPKPVPKPEVKKVTKKTVAKATKKKPAAKKAPKKVAKKAAKKSTKKSTNKTKKRRR
jgi:outer membrane biosynthesis protein TonB